jgi:hypothetical protein
LMILCFLAIVTLKADRLKAVVLDLAHGNKNTKQRD